MRHNDTMKTPSLAAPATPHTRPGRAAALLLVCLAPMVSAHAWNLSIASASRRVFLHVGNGSANADNGTVNTVSASLSGAELIGGTAKAMTSDSTQSSSLYDGFTTCPNPTTQVMVGASYRRNNANNGPASATLTVTSPANLTNANGDTIPFSEISWTVAAPGSSQPNVIAAGTFNGGTTTLATVSANRYIENCHTFTFANTAVRAAGTYTGQVTYTLSSQ